MMEARGRCDKNHRRPDYSEKREENRREIKLARAATLVTANIKPIIYTQSISIGNQANALYMNDFVGERKLEQKEPVEWIIHIQKRVQKR